MGAVTLHEAGVIDNYGSDKERQDARLLDTDDTWEEVPDNAIEQLPDALCFLDPESWRYYIPGYMAWALRNYRSSNWKWIDTVIYGLGYCNSKMHHTVGHFCSWTTLAKYKLDRFKLLNLAQALTVCRFLRNMASDHTGYQDRNAAVQALDSYWGRFLSDWEAEQTAGAEYEPNPDS